MKAILQISMIVLSLILTNCLDEKEEIKYAGVWRIDHYYVNSEDQTINYMSTHRDHLIYLSPNMLFKEKWISKNGPYEVNGTWRLSDHNNQIVLNDQVNGERDYRLKYYFYMSIKAGDQEWIFKKM